MQLIDWIVLFGVLGFIVLYGVLKSKNTSSMEGFLVGNRSMPWVDRLFVDHGNAGKCRYFSFDTRPGIRRRHALPSILFWIAVGNGDTLYHCSSFITEKLKVFTAYEYLETRFDVKVRSLAAFFFLILRGLSVGITVFAPSLILSTILGWRIEVTTAVIGSMVMIYTISGGSKAVSLTQKYQLMIIMGGNDPRGCDCILEIPDIVVWRNISLRGQCWQDESRKFQIRS
ncbi:MAG: hypothetical protein WDO15_27230 [Bacteroidota bacterium]